MTTSSVARRLTLLLSTLVGFALACIARVSANDPTATPPVFAEQDNPSSSQACTSLLDDPRDYFEGRLVVQLPVGVEPSFDPARDRYDAGEVVARCAGGRVITRVALLEAPDDPALELARVREQLLDSLELPRRREVEVREHDELARRTRVVVHLARAGERRSLALELRGDAGRLHVALFESRSADFEALLPSFTAALDSLTAADP